jgi:alpha-galactosidase
MWRIEDDLWDDWKSIKNMYFRTEIWAPFVTAGHWPDADMLPLGHIGIRAERGEDRLSRLTHDEQRTVMTLWGIFQSPLMFGGDLASLDPFTRSLLTNADVLAVSQHGSRPEVKYKNKDLRVWTSSAEGARGKYVAIFNLSDSPETTVLRWDEIGIDWRPLKVQDLWTHKRTSADREVKINLAPHASSLLRVQ